MEAEPSSAADPVIRMRGVSKSFGAVAALREVQLELRAGEAHALVGENGAGKSTLVKVLAGVHAPDAGGILLDGAPVSFGGPAQARDAGIAVIYQEPTLFPDLSVAENIFMGRFPTRRGRRIDERETRRRTADLFNRLGVPLNPERPARGLSIADQQLVEIAKALSWRARVLIMDEPTAALSGAEVDRLFAVVQSLRDAGAAVLFVSHRLDEVFSLCQRITVMRDGGWVSTDATEELTVDQVVRRMVGREMSSLFPTRDTQPGEVLLEVRDLTTQGTFTGVSFEVRAGEVVALAGLVGAGRTEVIRAIFGVDRCDRGEVRVAGRRLAPGRLSIASVLGLSCTVLGRLWFLGVTSLPLLIVLCLALGAALGAVNGTFVTVFGLPSLAVTIGTLALYRGLAYVVLGDRAVADYPVEWTSNATAPIPGLTIPWVILVVAGLAVLFGVVLYGTPVGRGLYAIGNNADAARFAGIAVARTKFWLYVLCGMMSALAGVFWTLRFASARADNATGMELPIVAAVLLGGVSIFGGRGGLVGAIAAVVLLGVLRNSLQLANVPANAINIVTGTLLISSVVGPNVVGMARERLRRRRSVPQPAAHG